MYFGVIPVALKLGEVTTSEEGTISSFSHRPKIWQNFGQILSTMINNKGKHKNIVSTLKKTIVLCLILAQQCSGEWWDTKVCDEIWLHSLKFFLMLLRIKFAYNKRIK